MAHKAAAGGSELSSGAEKKKMLLRKLLREPTLVTSLSTKRPGALQDELAIYIFFLGTRLV